MVSPNFQHGLSRFHKATPGDRYGAILHAAGDAFMAASKPGKEALLHFEELSLRLLPKSNLAVRASFARQLADCTSMPVSVALALAMDDIVVAAPIIRSFKAFSDNDCLRILAVGTDAHRHLIASRTDLSESIVLALSRKFHGRDTAELVPEDMISQPETLSAHRAKAESNQRIEREARDISTNGTINQSEERPEEMAGFPHTADMDHGDKRHALSAFLNAEPHEIYLTSREAERDAREKTAAPVKILARAFQTAERAAEFVDLARRGERHEFCRILATDLGLTTNDTGAILEDESGYALAVCLKALALPQDTAHEAFILLNDKLGQNAEQVFVLSWYYNDITPAAARLLVSRWVAGGERSAPVHKPYLNAAPTDRERSEALGSQTPLAPATPYPFESLSKPA